MLIYFGDEMGKYTTVTLKIETMEKLYRAKFLLMKKYSKRITINNVVDKAVDLLLEYLEGE